MFHHYCCSPLHFTCNLFFLLCDLSQHYPGVGALCFIEQGTSELTVITTADHKALSNRRVFTVKQNSCRESHIFSWKMQRTATNEQSKMMFLQYSSVLKLYRKMLFQLVDWNQNSLISKKPKIQLLCFCRRKFVITSLELRRHIKSLALFFSEAAHLLVRSYNTKDFSMFMNTDFKLSCTDMNAISVSGWKMENKYKHVCKFCQFLTEFHEMSQITWPLQPDT